MPSPSRIVTWQGAGQLAGSSRSVPNSCGAKHCRSSEERPVMPSASRDVARNQSMEQSE